MAQIFSNLLVDTIEEEEDPTTKHPWWWVREDLSMLSAHADGAWAQRLDAWITAAADWAQQPTLLEAS